MVSDRLIALIIALLISKEIVGQSVLQIAAWCFKPNQLQPTVKGKESMFHFTVGGKSYFSKTCCDNLTVWRILKRRKQAWWHPINGWNTVLNGRRKRWKSTHFYEPWQTGFFKAITDPYIMILWYSDNSYAASLAKAHTIGTSRPFIPAGQRCSPGPVCNYWGTVWEPRP